jgi:hypothetical protein
MPLTLSAMMEGWGQITMCVLVELTAATAAQKCRAGTNAHLQCPRPLRQLVLSPWPRLCQLPLRLLLSRVGVLLIFRLRRLLPLRHLAGAACRLNMEHNFPALMTPGATALAWSIASRVVNSESCGGGALISAGAKQIESKLPCEKARVYYYYDLR